VRVKEVVAPEVVLIEFAIGLFAPRCRASSVTCCAAAPYAARTRAAMRCVCCHTMLPLCALRAPLPVVAAHARGGRMSPTPRLHSPPNVLLRICVWRRRRCPARLRAIAQIRSSSVQRGSVWRPVVICRNIARHAAARLRVDRLCAISVHAVIIVAMKSGAFYVRHTVAAMAARMRMADGGRGGRYMPLRCAQKYQLLPRYR